MNDRPDEFTPYWLQTAMPSTGTGEMPGQPVMFPWEYPWPHTAPAAMWPASDPSGSSVLPPALASAPLAGNLDPSSQYWPQTVTTTGVSSGFPASPPTNPPWEWPRQGPASPGWDYSAMPMPSAPPHSALTTRVNALLDDDPFTRAAFRNQQSVRPEGGRREGKATRFLETYVPHVLKGLADLVTLPGRAPIPMPDGLQVTDAGELLINGQPAAETAEGRAWLEDQQRREDWGPEMALQMLTAGRTPGAAPPGAFGTFVGQRGAKGLTQGGLHPAVDPRTAMTDLEARAILEARQRAGDPRDADVFSRSGWIRGADGMLKKEIPDTGAKLVPTGNVHPLGEEFIWQHPAGNVHDVYDIKPMIIGPKVERRYGPGGTTDVEGRIYIAADPRTPEGLAYANRVAAEEIQHAIQVRERFAVGTDPMNEVLFPEYWKILGKPFPRGPEAPQIFREHRETVRRGLELGERNTPEYKAAVETYKRNAGEVEAKNVIDRLEKGYSKHPSETAAVPLQDQIIRDQEMQRRILDEALLGGLFRSPWD